MGQAMNDEEATKQLLELALEYTALNHFEARAYARKIAKAISHLTKTNYSVAKEHNGWSVHPSSWNRP